jgi:transcriptional regulator with XRE-family HTH domain
LHTETIRRSLMVSVVVLDGEITLGCRARLVRIAKGLRQFDVAVGAGVGPGDVSLFERDVPVPPGVRRRILAALGIEESAQEPADGQ